MKFSELQNLQRREGVTVISSDDRIATLESRLSTIAKERDALRAELDALKVWKEEVEKQEPVAWLHEDTNEVTVKAAMGPYFGGMCGTHIQPLYARPVPAQSVPEPIDPVTRVKDGIKHAPNYVTGWNDCRAAMLAAAPKPGVK